MYSGDIIRCEKTEVGMANKINDKNQQKTTEEIESKKCVRNVAVFTLG